MQGIKLFTEIFPVNTEALPELTAYKLEVSGSDNVDEISYKLCYRLETRFRGYWYWDEAGKHLLTDKPQAEEAMNNYLKELWEKREEVFRSLDAIKISPAYKPSTQGIASFVAKALLDDVAPAINKSLLGHRQEKEKYFINLVCDRYGWVVYGHPTVSISIKSELEYKDDLKAYTAKVQNVNDLIGLHVLDKTKPFESSMEITEIMGNLGEDGRREKLLQYTTSSAMQQRIENAPDDELVVKTKNRYDYISSVLKIKIHNKDYARFGISERLQIPTDQRVEIITLIADIIKKTGFVDSAYASTRKKQEKKHEHLFLTKEEIGYTDQLKIGDDQKVSPRGLFNGMKQHGLYRPSNNKQIRIAILNMMSEVSLENLRNALRENLGTQLGYNLLQSGKIINMDQPSRAQLEDAIGKLGQKKPDIILGIIPESNYLPDDEEWTLYDDFKDLTLQRNLQSQIIVSKNVNNPYIINNVVLGILAKTGNIPYVLAEPITYADLIVGLDVSRRQKDNLQGTTNAAGMARIYFANGELMRYNIREATLEGEIIPPNVLRGIFPQSDFANKKIIVHRDGNLPEPEKEALMKWGDEIDAKFYFVEVIKSGCPRLYATMGQKKVIKAPKGSIFTFGETEALLVSSEFPDSFKATPRPIRVCTHDSFPLKEALHSVLSLTLLHYGSVRPPRLPVTTYYADKISSMASRGLRPEAP